MLAKKPMHGGEIADEIGKRRGDKPKSGTIYPALKYLKEKKLIKGEKKGKTIIYSLTPKGRENVKYASEYFLKCFGDVFEMHKRMKKGGGRG